MPESVASVLVSILGVYVLVGLLVAVILHARGLAQIDSQVVGTNWRFRLLITPGLIALWPLLLMRMSRGGGDPPEERTAHREAAKAAH